MVVIMFLLSLFHWISTQKSVALAKCHYFENIQLPCKVAVKEHDSHQRTIWRLKLVE